MDHTVIYSLSNYEFQPRLPTSQEQIGSVSSILKPYENVHASFADAALIRIAIRRQ
jgi:hypothetical protein